ncbi:DUF5050 domain-containing protein [uncultured Trichococcus sp.]|uniref:DUF5050 domain-containing protein n=1 Tax=uncultured Trichococcus sp. TaxID=189665 RepID=UPI002A18CE9F|nr:DUF5050 domain-containing protein [uncultured Trichococcus sp.]
MKKNIGLLMMIIFGLALLTGCGSSETASIGMLKQSGDWIYYTDTKAEALYKMKADWTGKTKLADNFASGYMVIQGDTIYYSGMNGGVSKIQTDGTGAANVVDVGKESSYGFEVSGDWIYYSTKPGSIYKIKTDGTEKAKIADISSFEGDMKVSGDSIYYADGISLFKMQTDGTGVMKLLDNAVIHAVEGNWIFYGDKNQKGEYENVNRMKTDSTGQTKLAEGVFTAIDGNSLYYSKDGWLYRANLDGTAAEKMNKVKMWNILDIHGEYIYYGEYSGAAYRINLDGSDKKQFE